MNFKMTIKFQEEFKRPDGQVISIQFSIEGNWWEVACWDTDDTCRWYREFDNESSARKEFERWKD